MPEFGTLSRERLETCDELLRKLFRKVVGTYDCTVLDGHRNEADQTKAVREGRSKVNWPNGRHNSLPSKAADVAPYPVDWTNTKRFYHFAGYVQATADAMGIEIRCGCDWDRDFDLDDQSFMDLVHFELVD